MPRYLIGSKKRITHCFTCNPDVLDQAKGKLERGQSLSAILEALLEGWINGTYIIQPAKAGAPVTP